MKPDFDEKEFLGLIDKKFESFKDDVISTLLEVIRKKDVEIAELHEKINNIPSNEAEIAPSLNKDDVLYKLIEHAKNEQLGKETIFSWIKIKLQDSVTIDDMSSNLLSNMIETLLEDFESEQIEKIKKETQNTDLESLIEFFKCKIIDRAATELKLEKSSE